MNPFASSFSTPQPHPTGHLCPKCGVCLGVADIHTLSVGMARRAFYVCPNPKCSFEWTQAWKSVDKGEVISGDELIAVHEALTTWEGALTELIRDVPEVKPT